MLVYALCFLALLPVVNWAYHFVRNPSQVLSPLQGSLSKTPSSTWQNYGNDFEANSTDVITPEFLAALAQSESSGNPVAQPYWRWDFSSNPFEIYAPASSASGMFQLTEGTFQEAKNFCIHNGKVAKSGPWYEPNSCWFTWLYSRLSSSDSIEMVSARLHHLVEKIGISGGNASKREVAAVVHLCGYAKAQQFAKRGLKSVSRCGDHQVGAYLKRIRRFEKTFTALRAPSKSSDRKVAAQE